MKKLILFLIFTIKLNINLFSVSFNDNFILWNEFISLEKHKRPKIALVLGGGGARGFAHIGVIKVLEENNIPIDIVTGTSIGSIFGGLLASGLSSKEMETIVKEIKFRNLINLTFSSVLGFIFKNKFFKSDNIKNLIEKYTKNKNFYELNIPFACIAVDIKTGEKITLKEGNLADALVASSSIPGFFAPFEYKHRFLIDGGIVDNLPTKTAKDLGADIIIAINIESDYTQNTPKSILQVLLQISYIQGNRLLKNSKKLANILINPKVNQYSILDFYKRDELIKIGEIETRKNINYIKSYILDYYFKIKEL